MAFPAFPMTKKGNGPGNEVASDRLDFFLEYVKSYNMYRSLKTSKRICLNNRDFHKEILLTMAPHGRRTISFHGTKIKPFTRTDDHGSRKYPLPPSAWCPSFALIDHTRIFHNLKRYGHQNLIHGNHSLMGFYIQGL